MHLLKLNSDGKPSLTRFIAGNIPNYAILSHTWEADDQEVTFTDLADGIGVNKSGYRKIHFCGEQAQKDSLQYFWIDSCCIDKSNSSELQEAINSMFRWYRNAVKCYVYLSDVSTGKCSQSSGLPWETAFSNSRWFTRGWTLQELLAPSSVEFFSRQGKRLGDKKSLKAQIQHITGVPVQALQDNSLSKFSVHERMSWAVKRETTIEEDQAYCLLGIFNTYLPLIYGEGKENAFRRLRKEILGFSDNLLSLLPYAAEAPFNSKWRQHDPTCLLDTRVDLLQEIYSWADGRDKRCIFWLNGLAGTGKSTIARTVARRYFEQRRLGASFFFSRGGGGDVGRADKFITSIALQLASSVPSLYKGICDALMERRDIASQSLRDQWQQLILRPLWKLGENSSQSSYILVVDALDECDNDNNIRTILQLLAEARSLERVRLRVFLTSRPEIPIRHGLRGLPDADYQDFILHNIPSSVVNQDIRTFLEHTFGLIAQERSLVAGWPGQQIINHLVQCSSGLFIWAATTCRFIREGKRFATKRLDMILKQSRTAISAPEKHLNKIYITVLRHCISPEYSAEETEELKSMLTSLLGSIVTLLSPLSTQSLSKLLRTPQDEVDQTLDDLHAILDIPKDPSCPLRLHHPSFRDFLFEKTRCEEFWVDEKQAHQMLADSCIQLMSASAKQDICGLGAPGMLATDVKKSQVEQNLPPEVQYACLYWIQHLQKSDAQLRDDDQVHRFLQEHFLHWLEVLGWMGNVPEGVHAIASLESFISSRDCPSLLVFIHDMKRFVLCNRPAIEQAPLQSYCSALIFAPTTSIIRDNFKNCMPKWIRRLPKVEEKWNAVLYTLEGHLDSVNVVAFSRDGRMLASASDDDTVRLWDASSGAELQTLRGHPYGAKAVAFSPDGKMLVSVSDTVKLWDAGSGAVLQTFEVDSYSDAVRAVAFSPDGKTLVSVSHRKFTQWDNKSDATLQIPKGYSSEIKNINFLPDDRTLVSVFRSRLTLWDVGSGAVLQMLEGQSSKVKDRTIPPPFGKTLAMAFRGSPVKLWDVWLGAMLQTLEGHLSSIEAISFSADGKTLAMASRGVVKLWDAWSGATLQTLEGHWRWPKTRSLSPNSARSRAHLQRLTGRFCSVKAISFSPDGKTLATAASCVVKLWDVGSGALLQTFEGHSDEVTSVAFSPDSKTLASVSHDTVKLWDTDSGAVLQTLEGHSSEVKDMAFSPDGRMLASASKDFTVKLWDTRPRGVLQTLEDHLYEVTSVAFSPDGKTLVSVSDDTVKLWHVSSGEVLKTLKNDSDSESPVVTTMDFSPDGKMLALALDDTIVEMWDASSGMVLQTFDCISPPVLQMLEEGGADGHLLSVTSIVFSPDGKTLVSASGMTVKVWGAESGVVRQTLEGHLSWVNIVTFSLDGKALASASDDGMVKLWDVSLGVELQTLKGHSSQVSTVTFSPDGKMLASASYITVKLWNTGSGAELQTLNGQSDLDQLDGVNALIFSPDGKILVSSSFNTIKLWDADSGMKLQTLKGHSNSVKAMAFSPDGKTLASASDDMVKLWDTGSGALLQTFDGSAIIKSLSFSDDGTSLQINRGALSISLPRSNGIAIPQPLALPFINVKGQWVCHKSERILWLPSEYRSARILVYGNTIVLGCRSGRVTIMEFAF